jgi:peroxiredoxin Q/BCP
MKPLEVGDPAPDFTAETHTGQRISLADFRGQGAVVVFFYPMDGTAICTREACAFRDAYEDFVQAGAIVIGVSADSLDRHRTFADGHQLPFHLVSDSSGKLRQAFCVPKTLGFLPGRATYVIDPQGIVRHIFSAQFTANRHVTEALETVRKLAKA